MEKERESAAEDRAGGIQVIARTAKILNALGDTPDGMSLAEIAKAVDLPRSTVQRIVSALSQENIIQADRSDGVRLGPALLRLVARVHTDVVSIVTPYLEQLSREVDETVTLARINGRGLAFVHVVVAEHILRVMPPVGGDLPMHSTSGGRALLAMHSDSEVKALLGQHYKRLTDRTVHSITELLAIVEETRKRGYAWESDETVHGVSSLAFAIDTILGRYAVSIVLPTARAAEKRARVAECALRTKEALAAEIGRASNPIEPGDSPR
ncbi:IclR family transcriptional regulator [Burkholderia cenocepacia]|uniref:IclR family transcriptional regulator n=1 Tax=Burkholderia cenocepacia TaxID=95486 RepID=A0ABD4U6A8_9BURK|nr:IclR family transcriptional regulator [Burkholderia cenocepacia]MCW3604731.1 IclR family transcriptional regulator [Burkholderia cenocepacia]MCW3694232.1 IclR family transcriptional regulator [Burkholderia cenocepacia]MCW3702541.1 IclR family transcriptional regulator [Burkholderia cenocepacia]MCW3709811.1 IclR family transcriptional regulator [Burkholderia cenocepacia]MCW3718187.1 IclR family transcriptional regulator [Burkholderia cenocepacia]